MESIPTAEYQAIVNAIASDASPVGIDAKHTHVLILHKLQKIEERLARIEARMDAAPEPQE
ncbi:MAG: hypothetical protein RLY93_09755 [Sumerlaeia bacterium]